MRGVVKASHSVQIFTTVGLSTALQNAALVAWTGDFRFVRPWHSGVVIRIGEAAFNLSQVVAFLVAVLFTAALVAFMKWTRAGRIMRATAQDVEAATLMGIDTDQVYRLAWAIGLVRVRIPGALMSPLSSVHPPAGLHFVLHAHRARVRGARGAMIWAAPGAV